MVVQFLKLSSATRILPAERGTRRCAIRLPGEDRGTLGGNAAGVHGVTLCACQCAQYVPYSCLYGSNELFGILLDLSGPGAHKRYRLQAACYRLTVLIQQQRSAGVCALVDCQYVIHSYRYHNG